jgi:hypothetical protein
MTTYNFMYDWQAYKLQIIQFIDIYIWGWRVSCKKKNTIDALDTIYKKKVQLIGNLAANFRY